jgi:hypothetical protein
LEKSFSVAVEMEGGEKRTLTVQGASSGSVFQQVKAMPGVRRVGRVAEIGADGYVAPSPSPTSAGREQKSDDRQPAQAPTNSVFMGTGPRVVIGSRNGGEQPFKNLYIPPERLATPKPTPPPQPVKPVMKAVPVAKAAPAPVVAAPKPVEEPVQSQEEVGQQPSLEYRIVKSRRQNGDPYLLQRGTWGEQKGKRAFTIDWEKGFPDREKAEAHHRWMQQMAAEMAQVAELGEAEEIEEVEEVGA